MEAERSSTKAVTIATSILLRLISGGMHHEACRRDTLAAIVAVQRAAASLQCTSCNTSILSGAISRGQQFAAGILSLMSVGEDPVEIPSSGMTMKASCIHSDLIDHRGYTIATAGASVEAPKSISTNLPADVRAGLDRNGAGIGLVLQVWRPDELKGQNSTGVGIVDFSFQTEQPEFKEVTISGLHRPIVIKIPIRNTSEDSNVHIPARMQTHTYARAHTATLAFSHTLHTG